MNGIATFDISNGRPKEKGMTLRVQVLFILLYLQKKKQSSFLLANKIRFGLELE